MSRLAFNHILLHFQSWSTFSTMTRPFGRASNDELGGPFEAPGSAEREALLPSPTQGHYNDTLASPKEKGIVPSDTPRLPFRPAHASIAFVTGIVACVLAQLAICGPSCFTPRGVMHSSSQTERPAPQVFAPPWVGSSEVHPFPPTKPTNAYPSWFPTSVGYAGPTPTGAEPALIATAPVYPYQSGQCAKQLVHPETLASEPVKFESKAKEGSKSKDFNMFKSWGNLSPWYSNSKGAFGIDSTPEPPESCRITGLHVLHRHGARYPTEWASYGGPARLAEDIHRSTQNWNATGELEFLNEWSYKLGEELLTPFGRKQLCELGPFVCYGVGLTFTPVDLGLSYRMKYGFLLKNFTESNTIPVFRTESQDRMLASAMNFAIGFFGWPLDGQYQQSITIEADGVRPFSSSS